MTSKSEYYLKRTRAAAKEIELGVPETARAKNDVHIEDLFPLVVSYVGDLAYKIVKTNEIISQDDKSKLVFASKFLTSYVMLNPSKDITEKYLAVGAVAGYLCDRVGDAALLASKIDLNGGNFNPLFITLVYILKNNEKSDFLDFNGICGYKDILRKFVDEYRFSIKNGTALNYDIVQMLKNEIYSNGSDNELLMVDLLLAVCKMKCMYSIAAMIKEHNKMSAEKKALLLSNNALIKEFWPAQRLMLKKGFFDGKSGIIQLPTGAGKTKSISLCVYSYFASYEKSISVIVSPFNALCRETANSLKNDLKFDKSISVVKLTDVMKFDYEMPESDNTDRKSVVVVTPEKLLYVLRHEPDFALDIGQIIFDEGHLFEDDKRGAKYELLVASILQMLKEERPQIIMISAIVSGVNKLNQWISEGTGEIISEVSIATTEKYTASLEQRKIADKWYLYLDYLNSENLAEQDFFVPRFIEQKYYSKKNKQIAFPNDNKEASIATLLRLAKYANCALFTGRKDWVNSLAQKIVDISGYIDVSSLSARNNPVEQMKLCNLILNNYGKESIYYKCSLLGGFLHHAGISEGIKASIEYAIANGRISNVICTSTLSQGVNLPIKYLIVDSIYQGKDPIGKQDFKNLIGRVGRSGMFTEGTIIYSDYNAYKEKNWRWEKFVELYNNSNADCYSQLLWVCGYYNDIDLLLLVKQYYDSGKKDDQAIIDKLPGKEEEKKECWKHIKEILADFESFIAQWDVVNDESIECLIKRTLLFQSAGQECGNRLAEVFRIIENYLCNQITSYEDRISYSKSLLSIEDYTALKASVENLSIDENQSVDEIRCWCLEKIYNLSDNKAVTNFDIDSVKQIADLWIQGTSYGEIYQICKDKKVKWGQKTRKVKLEDISEICNGGFNYSATIILNAIYELLLNAGDEYKEIADCVSDYLLMLKYGLSDMNAIYLYEMGMNDRSISQEMAEQILLPCKNKSDLVLGIRMARKKLEELLTNYPEYFTKQFMQIV